LKKLQAHDLTMQNAVNRAEYDA